MTEDQIKKLVTESISAAFAAEQAKNKVQFELDRNEIKSGSVIELDGQKFTLAEVTNDEEEEAKKAEMAAAEAKGKMAALSKALADAVKMGDKDSIVATEENKESLIQSFNF